MLIPKISLSERSIHSDNPFSRDYPIFSVEVVPQLLLAHGVNYYRVDTLNWPVDYPYCPQVEVALAHIGSHLLVHYRVSETCLRALAESDGGRVWEDSCCELFLQPDTRFGIPYYNIECNCAGKLLLAEGVDRHQRHPASATIMQTISRWSSLGSEKIPLTDGPAHWDLALAIPATALFDAGIEDFTGMTMRGNIYKCGDALTTPHFLSLFPIRTKTPDFHRPEFFQDFHFEG